MELKQNIKNILKKSLNIDDKSSRTEFLVFHLFYTILFSTILLGLNIGIFGSASELVGASMSFMIILLVIFSICIQLRRLEDIGLSGYYCFILMVPLVQFIYYISLFLIPSNYVEKKIIKRPYDSEYIPPTKGQYIFTWLIFAFLNYIISFAVTPNSPKISEGQNPFSYIIAFDGIIGNFILFISFILIYNSQKNLNVKKVLPWLILIILGSNIKFFEELKKLGVNLEFYLKEIVVLMIFSFITILAIYLYYRKNPKRWHD